MKILFILWESWSGKTTLEKYLVENHWFKTFDKLSSHPPRDDDSGYTHFPAKQITDMYVDGLVHECIKFDWNIYAMRIPNGNPNDKYVAVMVPSGYHQMLDLWIQDGNEVYSIFMTNNKCREWMEKRWDSKESIERRMILNERLMKYSGSHDVINGERWAECITHTLSLLYPRLFL